MLMMKGLVEGVELDLTSKPSVCKSCEGQKKAYNKGSLLELSNYLVGMV